MRAVLRRTRYGYLLAFHIVLLCAAGRDPTEIAAFLLCSRSSVYRIVHTYRTGSLGIRVTKRAIFLLWCSRPSSCPGSRALWAPYSKKSHVSMAGAAPGGVVQPFRRHAPGEHGIEVSAETVRRWLHERGWVWKRATGWRKMTTHTGSSG